MNLSQKLRKIHKIFFSEVSHVVNFVKEIDTRLINKIKTAAPPDFTKADGAELEKLINIFKKTIDGKIKKRAHFRLHSRKLADLILNLIVPAQQKRFLAEMSLSYLISYQEAFLKDYLKAILCDRRFLLKSKKTLSYEEVCSYNSIDSLVSNLAQREVDSLGFGSIDDFADYYKKKFNIAFQELKGYSKLREANYRRNLIIHNRSITNELYCKKIGYKKLAQHLLTEVSYVILVGNLILRFVDFIHRMMLKKLALEKSSSTG